MTLADVIFTQTCYNNDCNDFFTINDNYSGYTYDHETFHVLDHAANAYTSYSAADFDAALQSGVFDNPGGVPIVPGVNNNNGTIFIPNSPGQNNDLIKTVFIGAAVVMVVYIALK